MSLPSAHGGGKGFLRFYAAALYRAAAAKGHMEDSGAPTPTVSPDASSAPAPDTAAASAPPAADAPQAPAATQSNESAASTETGAPAAPSSLDDIWKDFSSRATQEEQAAPEASADAAPAKADEPKPEPKPDAEEKPADEQVETTDAEEPTPEPDPLADEPAIPTRDEINENFKRAPKAVRDFAADMAERAAEAEGKLSKIGGDEGAQVAEAIMPHLFTAQPSPENAIGMFETLVDTNPALVASMGEQFINYALDDERTGAAFGDRLLNQRWEGYNADRIDELVRLDREGLIDVDALREDLGTGREPTARERELEAKLKESEGRVKELTGGTEDATRREEQRLAQTVDTEVTRALKAKIQPIRETLKWVEKKGDAAGPHAGLLDELGNLAESSMLAAVKTSPEWDAIQQLVAEGTAFRDGKPTRLMRLQLEAIERRGTALFKATARRLKPAISALAGQQQPPPADDPPPPPTEGRSGGDANTTERPADARPRKYESLEDIGRDFDTRTRESRASVGTLRR